MKSPSRSLAFFSRLVLLGWAGTSAAAAQDFITPPTLTLSEGHSPANLGTFDIVINAGTGLSGNAAALAAFNRAAQQWEAFFSDPITITIDADLGALGPGIIGSAGSVTLVGSYNTIRNQMVADSLDEADDSIVSLLPTAAQFTAMVASGSVLDGDIQGNKAALKAAGFTGLDTMFGVSDANITFSSSFSLASGETTVQIEHRDDPTPAVAIASGETASVLKALTEKRRTPATVEIRWQNRGEVPVVEVVRIIAPRWSL